MLGKSCDEWCELQCSSNHPNRMIDRWEMKNIIPHKHILLRAQAVRSLFDVRFFAVFFCSVNHNFQSVFGFVVILFFCWFPKQIENPFEMCHFWRTLYRRVHGLCHVHKIGCAITCCWFHGDFSDDVNDVITSYVLISNSCHPERWWNLEWCFEYWAVVVKRMQFDWHSLIQWNGNSINLCTTYFYATIALILSDF